VNRNEDAIAEQVGFGEARSENRDNDDPSDRDLVFESGAESLHL
jgi:hypothetical protein